TRISTFSGAADHGGRAIDAKKFPLRQSPRELHQNLTRSAANIKSAASDAANQAKRMFHEGVVNPAEVGVRRCGGIGLHFARIVHHLGFGHASQVKAFHEPAHRAESSRQLIALTSGDQSLERILWRLRRSVVSEGR